MSQFPGLPGQLGEAIAAELAAQRDSAADMASALNENRARSASVYDSILAGMVRPSKQPELPDDVKEIVAVLLAQPRLMAPTKTWLQAKVAQINQAVDQILQAP